MTVDALLDAVADELADDRARDNPDGGRRQQRRREEANREPDPAAPQSRVAVDVRCHDPIIGAPAQDFLTRRG